MNQLPQATALPIPPELIRKTSPRKDWFSPRIQPPARKETSEATETTAPVERVWTVQQDWHVNAYMEWCANEPLAFLKLRCREMGVQFSDVVGDSRRREHHIPRGILMAEVKRRFPGMSMPALGKIFNRNHATVLHYLRKHGVSTGEPHARYKHVMLHADRVLEMLKAGKKQIEIAREIGASPTAVSMLVMSKGWRDVNPYRPQRMVADHKDAVRRLMNIGYSSEAIGREIGFTATNVRRFIRKMGWR